VNLGTADFERARLSGVANKRRTHNGHLDPAAPSLDLSQTSPEEVAGILARSTGSTSSRSSSPYGSGSSTIISDRMITTVKTRLGAVEARCPGHRCCHLEGRRPSGARPQRPASVYARKRLPESSHVTARNGSCGSNIQSAVSRTLIYVSLQLSLRP